MKIAYVTADSGAPVFGTKGASIHIRELVNAFSDLGHAVTILTAKMGDGTGKLHAEAIKIRVDRADTGLETESDSERAHRFAKERRYLDVGKAMETHLLRLHTQQAFDLVYERYSLWSAAGVRVARQLHIPCVVEVNAPLVLEQQKYRKLALINEAKAIEAEVFTTASSVVAVSEEIKNYVVAEGADPARTIVIPNAVDTKRFNPNVEPFPVGVMDNGFIVGFVGSLKIWHGTETLLDAFILLQKRVPAGHLLVVGDGPLRSWIEGYVRGARVEPNVTFTGWVGYDCLPGLLQRMDVAVAPYPALDRFYFSPLKLYEYLAMGKAVVASAIGQVCEVIDDGINGLLTRPGDADDLAEKLERLYRDPELRQSLGHAARRASACTWTRNAKRVVAIADTLTQELSPQRWHKATEV